MILLDNASFTNAKLVADKVRMEIENCREINEIIGRKITVSIGISSWSEVSSIEDWLEISDKRLYLAKEQGRNRVVFSG